VTGIAGDLVIAQLDGCGAGWVQNAVAHKRMLSITAESLPFKGKRLPRDFKTLFPLSFGISPPA
jgi:hypothetical protein